MDCSITIEELKNAFVNKTPIIFTKQYEEYIVKKTGLISKISQTDVLDYAIYIEIEPKIFYKVIFSGAKFFIK